MDKFLAETAGKVLGPSCEILGDLLKDFTVIRTTNVKKIIDKAKAKLGDSINEPGNVPPIVIKNVIDEGSWKDDDLAIDYYAGILASSKSKNGRDDRGAQMAKRVTNLSTYQLRFHYLYYSTFLNLFLDSGKVFTEKDNGEFVIYIPVKSYFENMKFNDNEFKKRDVLVTHTLFGLRSENLIDDFRYGGNESLKLADNIISKIEFLKSDQGIVLKPTSTGLELYLWAYGYMDCENYKVLNSNLIFENLLNEESNIFMNCIHIP